MEENYIITAQDICKEFMVGGQPLKVLHNVNVKIRSGKLTILRGRSGSGKTTLLNILSSLDRPTSGSVFLEGEDVCKMSDTKRDDIRRTKEGFIFQSVALISTMTGYENVEFAMRVAQNKMRNASQTIHEWLKLVDVDKRANHRPGEMSGGEQQRIAIVRAMINNPKVVFADEPTAELDTNTGLQVVELFKKLIEQKNITVVMTTHDPNMMELADCVYTLEDGRITDELVR